MFSIRLAFGLVLVALVAPSSSQPEKTCPEDYRLPKNIVPEHYDLKLRFNRSSVLGEVKIFIQVLPPRSKKTQSLEDLEKSWTSPGVSSILYGRLSKCKGIKSAIQNQIIMNVDESVEITDVEYIPSKEGYLKKILPWTKTDKPAIIQYDGKLLIIIDHELSLEPKSRGYLKLKFKSTMRKDFRGVYANRDCKNDVIKIAQFKPTNARLVFPCFDEPHFKATFKISITHNPDETALSNMPIERTYNMNGARVTEFQKTSPMSIHKVTFAVGKFDKVERAGVGKKKIKSRIYMPVGLRDSANFAHEVAIKSIEWMERYLSYPYPSKKFDIVVLSDLDKDSYENLGLNFLRANMLLFDPASTRSDLKVSIALNVAHVVAHQWFSHVMTTEWWDSIWISQVFAAQSAFKIVQELYPDFQSEYFTRLDYLSNRLQMDSTIGGLHALSPNPRKLATSEQVHRLFDNLTFVKAASLAQSIEHKLQFFKQFLRGLVIRYSKDTIDNESFFSVYHQNSRGYDNTQFPFHLLSASSYPVINLDVENDKIRLTVSKIRITSLKLSLQFGYAWHLNETLNFTISKQTAYIGTPKWFKIRNKLHWIKMNPNPDISTYFRVNYSQTLVQYKLMYAIEEKFMNPLDRLNVIDDAAGLAKAGGMDTNLFKQLLGHYHNEDHGGVIMGMVEASKVLLELEPNSLLAKEVLMKLYRHYGFSNKWSKSHVDQCAQIMTINALIDIRNEEVINDALRLFDNRDKTKISLHLREPIETAVIKYGSKEQKNRWLNTVKAQRTLLCRPKDYDRKRPSYDMLSSSLLNKLSSLTSTIGQMQLPILNVIR